MYIKKIEFIYTYNRPSYEYKLNYISKIPWSAKKIMHTTFTRNL